MLIRFGVYKRIIMEVINRAFGEVILRYYILIYERFPYLPTHVGSIVKIINTEFG